VAAALVNSLGGEGNALYPVFSGCIFVRASVVAQAGGVFFIVAFPLPKLV